MEKDNRKRSVHRIDLRNSRSSPPPRIDTDGWRSGWDQGRLARCRAAYVSELDGAEFLDGNLGMDHLLLGDRSVEPGDPAPRRERPGWAGVLTDRSPAGHRIAMVSAAGHAGVGRARA